MTIKSQSPRGLLRGALRLPVLLYRLHLCWVLGERFLELTHIGRHSGLPHRTVVEVVYHDPATDTYYVASGWGGHSDWYRNVLKTPQVTVDVGRRHFKSTAVHLTHEEAREVLIEYSRRHSLAFQELAVMMLGHRGNSRDEAINELADSAPVLGLRPGYKPSP
jgi:deazaflavin-dependent oxidoreductase (nitroreductase family)